MPARTRSRSRGRRASSGSAAGTPPTAASKADQKSPKQNKADNSAAHEVTPEEAMSQSLLQAIFDAYDDNGDGVLSLEELSEAFVAVGVPRSVLEVKMLLEEADKDHSGDVDFEEFVAVVQSAGKASPWTALAEAGPPGSANVEREALVAMEASLSRVLAPLQEHAHKDALLLAEADNSRYVHVAGTNVFVPLASAGSRVLGRAAGVLVMLAMAAAASIACACTAGSTMAAVAWYVKGGYAAAEAAFFTEAACAGKWGLLLGPLAYIVFPALRPGKGVSQWAVGNTVMVLATGRPLGPFLGMLREVLVLPPLDLFTGLYASQHAQRAVDMLLGTVVVADVVKADDSAE